MRLSSSFWTSKTTWTGIAGIISIVVTEFLHRHDLLLPILGIVGALQAMFVKDGIEKAADRVVAAHVAGVVDPEQASQVADAVREREERAAALSKLSPREQSLLGVAEESAL